MTRNELIMQLSHGLNHDLHDYRQLKEQLEVQFDAARLHDAARLAAISETVEQLAGEIEARRRERVDLVTRLFEGDAEATMERVFSLLPQAASQMLRSWWSELHSLVGDCKAQNTRTCHLLTEQQEIMRRILGDDEDTYAPV